MKPDKQHLIAFLILATCWVTLAFAAVHREVFQMTPPVPHPRVPHCNFVTMHKMTLTGYHYNYRTVACLDMADLRYIPLYESPK